jgi:nicotinate-nucleotide pyrophosphorylase (carboxylating)
VAGRRRALRADQVVLRSRARPRLLTPSGTALNFLQLVCAVRPRPAACRCRCAARGARIVDTRKTLPGLRLARNTRCAGGRRQPRIGLYDAVLIKENHIAAAGGVVPVLQADAARRGHASFIEIEVETLEQLQEALDGRAKMVLLDNMDLPTLRDAVRINAGRAILEISAASRWSACASWRRPGVDRISIGHPDEGREGHGLLHAAERDRMSAVIPIKDVEYEHPLPGNTCDTKHAWARVPLEPSPASARR